jgi:hypothetical protein
MAADRQAIALVMSGSTVTSYNFPKGLGKVVWACVRHDAAGSWQLPVPVGWHASAVLAACSPDQAHCTSLTQADKTSGDKTQFTST